MRQFHISVPAQGHELDSFKNFWYEEEYLLSKDAVTFWDVLSIYRVFYKDFVDFNDDLYLDAYFQMYLCKDEVKLEIAKTVDEDYTLYRHLRDKRQIKL